MTEDAEKVTRDDLSRLWAELTEDGKLDRAVTDLRAALDECRRALHKYVARNDGLEAQFQAMADRAVYLCQLAVIDPARGRWRG